MVSGKLSEKTSGWEIVYQVKCKGNNQSLSLQHSYKCWMGMADYVQFQHWEGRDTGAPKGAA